MGKPHKHTDLIKAWADGAEIQCHYEDYGWIDTSPPPSGWSSITIVSSQKNKRN